MFALLLLWPAVAFAHALSPTHFPLGPMPILIWMECRPLVWLLPITLAAETLVLWAWMRQLGVLGNLWRAALLYIAGRVCETAALACLGGIGMTPGWYGGAPEIFGTLAVCLLAGWAGKLGAARFLYRHAGFHVRELLVPVTVATAAGYVAALSLVAAFGPGAAHDLLLLIESMWR
jgi:hypothetical protein